MSKSKKIVSFPDTVTAKDWNEQLMDRWIDVHVTFDLGWTTEKPTEPGWYWAFPDAKQNPEHEGWQIVRVWKSEPRSKLNVEIMGTARHTEFDEFVRWIGPISQPEPPAKSG